MTLLIGVRHYKEYSQEVIDRLSLEDLTNKKVMLEVYSFPIDEESKIFDGCSQFWKTIGNYILQRQGRIIPGDNKELFWKAQKRMSRLNKITNSIYTSLHQFREKVYEEEYHRGYPKEKDLEKLKSLEEKTGKIGKRIHHLYHNVAPHKKRDPYFKKVIDEQSPDIIILGNSHVPYILEHCNITYLDYFPRERLITALNQLDSK